MAFILLKKKLEYVLRTIKVIMAFKVIMYNEYQFHVYDHFKLIDVLLMHASWRKGTMTKAFDTKDILFIFDIVLFMSCSSSAFS